jgi:hypothetical protein
MEKVMSMDKEALDVPGTLGGGDVSTLGDKAELNAAVAYVAAGAWLVNKNVMPMSHVREVLLDGITYEARLAGDRVHVTGVPSVFEMNRMNLEGRTVESQLREAERKLLIEERSRKDILDAVSALETARRHRDETPEDAPSIRAGFEREIDLMEENLVGHEEWLSQVDSRIFGLRGEVSGLSERLSEIRSAEVPEVRRWEFGLGDLRFYSKF